MKWITYSFVALCSLLLSCTNKDIIKKKQNGVVGICIDSPCDKPTMTVNCYDAFAMYQAGAANGQDIITIQGDFNDGSAVKIDAVWDGNPMNKTFNLDENAVGQGNWGIGTYLLHIGEFKSYTTIDGGKGTMAITDYDQTNQRISGTFEFTGKYFDGNNYQNSFRKFYGSFTNVPIMDANNPGDICNGSSGTGSGNTGGSGGTGTGGGTGSGGNTGGGVSSASLNYVNNTFTPVDITIGGVQKTISPGSSVTFTGSANSNYSGTASTSGKTTSGTRVGLQIQWTLNGSFPASGTKTVNLNVGYGFFFLKIKNSTNETFNKVYVNYGLQSQTFENLSLAGGGTTYSLGYYSAYTNSNVRVESSQHYWYWNALNLPFTENQQVTLTAQ